MGAVEELARIKGEEDARRLDSPQRARVQIDNDNETQT